MLLVNSRSRRGKEWFEPVRAALLEGGIKLVDAVAFRRPNQLVEAAKLHVESGVPMVIVGGGDGTFSSVARHFSHKKTILGVLPLGTGNSFARDLGIEASVEKASEVLLNGKIAQIDMGCIEGKSFLNVATIGVTTRIAQSLESGLKKYWGRAVYAVSLFKALREIEPFRVKLSFPNGEHDFESLQVVIGNGRFHAGPFPVAPDAHLDSGFLSVYALASSRKSAFFKMALRLFGGHHVDLPEVKAFRVREGRIEADPPQKLVVDGEVSKPTPAGFSVVSHALKVVVPEDWEA